MQLLFLDVETTGLSPFKDQIIELAGVIVDLNLTNFEFKEIATFQSLIKLRKAFDQKTTRITGITYEEVLNAPELFAVQKDWESWLADFEEIKHVVGHSVQFDLSFLNSEKWFLPLDYKVIDTLDLSRMLLGNLSAINQEFITEKLNLLDFETDQKHHRSLFDTRANIRVLTNLLSKLQELNFSSEITQILLQNFLPLPITFFPNSKVKLVTKPVENKLKIEQVDFEGVFLEPKTFQKIDFLNSINLEVKILDLLMVAGLSLKLKGYLLQFYFLNIASLLGQKNLKLHLQNGKQDYLLTNFLLDYLLPTSFYCDLQTKQPKLEEFESILLKLGSVSENHLHLGKIIEYLSILKDFLALEKNLELLENIEKLTLAFDFWVANVDRASRFGVLELNMTTLADEFGLKKGLASILEKLQEVVNLLQPKQFLVEILGLLKIEVLGLVNSGNLDLKHVNILNFRQNNGFLAISWVKTNFNLAGFLAEKLTKFENLQITTYLPQVTFETFTKILGLEKFVPISFSVEKEFKAMYDQNLESLFKEQLLLAQENKQICLILGGLNSSLKDSQRVLEENFEVTDYLILGETGSMTKIFSKIKNGFSGLVILKFSNLDFVLNSLEIGRIGNIFVVNQPYFAISNFLESYLKKSPNYLDYKSFLKKIYLLSNWYKVWQKYHKEVQFVSSYR